MTTAPLPTLPIRRAHAPVLPRVTEEPRATRPDPADIAAAIRDLAVRAHRAVRAAEFDEGARFELAALHPRIVELQRNLDGQSQRGLAAYLAALRRAVESRLG